jgi:MarR family transcriptional regulator, organic hydroperoxide resistance regulator
LTIVVATTILQIMVGKLKEEIKQNKPFESLEAEVFLNLQRTTDALSRGLIEMMKPFGISLAQYNVLRILRGAGEEGLACRDISERMVTRDPDITRLLDRLEASDLVKRAREQTDRRVITVRITDNGLKLLEDLHESLVELQRRQLGHLGKTKLQTLIELLELARENTT